jgi:hypothetical protein
VHVGGLGVGDTLIEAQISGIVGNGSPTSTVPQPTVEEAASALVDNDGRVVASLFACPSPFNFFRQFTCLHFPSRNPTRTHLEFPSVPPSHTHTRAPPLPLSVVATALACRLGVVFVCALFSTVIFKVSALPPPTSAARPPPPPPPPLLAWNQSQSSTPPSSPPRREHDHMDGLGFDEGIHMHRRSMVPGPPPLPVTPSPAAPPQRHPRSVSATLPLTVVTEADDDEGVVGFLDEVHSGDTPGGGGRESGRGRSAEVRRAGGGEREEAELQRITGGRSPIRMAQYSRTPQMNGTHIHD